MPPRRGSPCPSKSKTPTMHSLQFRAGCGTASASISSLPPSPSLPERSDSISPAAFATKETQKRKWTAPIWKEYDVYVGELFKDSIHRALCKYCRGGILAPKTDPRYKSQLVLCCFKKLNIETVSSKANHVKDQFSKLYDEYAVLFSPQLRGTMSEVQDKRRDALKGFSYFDDISEDNLN